MAKGLDEILKERHPNGIKGILFMHSWTKIRRGLPFKGAIVGTLIGMLLLCLSNKDNYKLLRELLEISLSIMPNLLGFSLGGYALIVGFGNTALLKSMTVKLKDEKGSLFQKLSAILAFSVLLQVACLILSYLFMFLYNLNLSLIKHQEFTSMAYPVINGLAMSILLFMFIWMFLQLPFVVTNIFTFGQTHHFYLTVERVKENPHLFQKELELENLSIDNSTESSTDSHNTRYANNDPQA